MNGWLNDQGLAGLQAHETHPGAIDTGLAGREPEARADGYQAGLPGCNDTEWKQRSLLVIRIVRSEPDVRGRIGNGSITEQRLLQPPTCLLYTSPSPRD